MLTARLEVDGPPRRFKPALFSVPALPIAPLRRHAEIAAELFCEIDRYAGMHAALSVQKLGIVVERHDRPVPNIRMNEKASAAVAPERDELLWRHIVGPEGRAA